MAAYERPAMATPIVVERNKMRDWGRLLIGVGATLVGIAALLYVLFVMLASVTATPFDADGVRCYHRGAEIACLRTGGP